MRSLLLLLALAGAALGQKAETEPATIRPDREYQRGMRSLDRREWAEALTQFGAAAGGSRPDGALFWKAYALAKLGRGGEATAALDELAKAHPQSRWANDAKALRVEIAQSSGKPVSPESESDDEIKLMAINSLMNSDAERAVPLLEKLLRTQTSPALRSRALFVLSQSGSPKAKDVVLRLAKGEGNPDLQLMAVRNLGIYGGKENQQTLGDIYTASSDAAVKSEILRALMISGGREQVGRIARTEPSEELRGAAINQLGAMGAGEQLSELYASEKSKNVRVRILRAFVAAGDGKRVVEIARKETDPELKKAAVRVLSTMQSKEATDFLMELINK